MERSELRKPSERMRVAILERALREIALDLKIVDRVGGPFWPPSKIAREALIEAGVWERGENE